MGKASRNKGNQAGDRQAKIQAAGGKKPGAARKGGGNGFIIGTAVAVIAIIAVVVTTIVVTQSNGGGGKGGSDVPAHAAGMGKPILANFEATTTDDTPVLDIYQDYQCPICKQFEDSFGSTIDELATAGKIKYQVHMMSFLDNNLGNDASNRAANAAACVSDAGKFMAFNKTIYANQPANEGDGYTDDQLKQYAEDAGVTGDALSTWETCYDDKAHNQYVESIQEQSSKDGVQGTPTVKLDGQVIELQELTSPEVLKAKVEAAAK